MQIRKISFVLYDILLKMFAGGYLPPLFIIICQKIQIFLDLVEVTFPSPSIGLYHEYKYYISAG